MENNPSPPRFNEQALARFVAAQGLRIEKIICHLWVNTMDKNGPVELIDNVELWFEGGKKLTIGLDQTGDGLDALDFNYKESAAELHQEFGDKIRLIAVNASSTKMWEAVIGKTLLAVRVTKDEDRYRADTVVLDFGEEKREISAAPLDGVIIDYFEED